MFKEGSATWLIIFLCAVILLLGWVVFNNQTVQKTASLSEELKKIQQQSESALKNKDIEISRLKDIINTLQIANIASSSALPSAKPSPLTTKESTSSGALY
jgi:predicted PurR-regulated permease PerM